MFLRAALLLVVLGCGCKAPLTEIVVSVKSDLLVPRELDRITIRVDRASTQLVELSWDLSDTRALPATIGLLPRDSSAGGTPVLITLRGLSGEREVVVRHALLPFAEGRVLLLSMNLLRRCIDVKCGPDETCAELGCRTRAYDTLTLPSFTYDAAMAPLVDGGGTERGLDRARSDSRSDGPVKDAPRPIDGPRPDAKADGAKGDAAKSDGPKSDGPKPDGPKADQAKAPDGNTTSCGGGPVGTASAAQPLTGLVAAMSPSSNSVHVVYAMGTSVYYTVYFGGSWTADPAPFETTADISRSSLIVDSVGVVHFVAGLAGGKQTLFRKIGASWVPVPLKVGFSGQSVLTLAGSNVFLASHNMGQLLLEDVTGATPVPVMAPEAIACDVSQLRLAHGAGLTVAAVSCLQNNNARLELRRNQGTKANTVIFGVRFAPVPFDLRVDSTQNTHVVLIDGSTLEKRTWGPSGVPVSPETIATGVSSGTVAISINTSVLYGLLGTTGAVQIFDATQIKRTIEVDKFVTFDALMLESRGPSILTQHAVYFRRPGNDAVYRACQ